MKFDVLKKKVMPCLMSALMLATIVFGVTPVYADNGITILSDTSMSFDTYLVMDKEANVPSATFSYSVSAGIASGDILAGVNASDVTVTGTSANTVKFTTSDSAVTGSNSAVKNYNSSAQKYAKKTVSVDFSGCTFNEAGTYRYVITESGSNQGVTIDSNVKRTVDVYVVNDGEPITEEHVVCGGCGMDFGMGPEADDAAGEHLVEADFFGPCQNYSVKTVTVYPTAISGYIMYDGTTKSSGFTNTYDTSNLTFRKEVSGNQASYNKYFPFTVKITNAVAGTIYDVDLSNAETNPNGNTNPSKLTVGSNGTVSQTFYLKHGQEIKINGIAKSSKYTVTEDAGDYTSTAAGVTNYTGATSGTIASADVKTSYLNTKNGVVPTGIAMNVAPFAMVALVGCAGIVGVVTKHNKYDD